MRPTYIILLLCFLIHGNAFSQNTPASADSMAIHQTRLLTQKLKLNASQQEQIQAAYKQRHETLVSLRSQKDSLNRASAIKAAYERFEETLRSTLTADQYKQYLNMIGERKAAMERAMKSKGNEPKKLE